MVDNEVDVTEPFRQRFRREVRQGTCAMHFANSGEEALERLASGIEPMLFVILSDINMPGMDGLTLLREVKARQPDLPVMTVTAYSDDERRRLTDEYGAAEFITKPVEFELLKAQLRQLPNVAAAERKRRPNGRFLVSCVVLAMSATGQLLPYHRGIGVSGVRQKAGPAPQGPGRRRCAVNRRSYLPRRAVDVERAMVYCRAGLAISSRLSG